MRPLLFLFLLAGCSPNAPVSAPATAASQATTTPTASTTMPNQRRTIYFTGRVQGVGFRATTVELARGLHLAGEVKNLPDGRVELVVEGSAGDIDRLLSRLREHFGGGIRKVEQDTSIPRGMEPGLRIAY